MRVFFNLTSNFILKSSKALNLFTKSNKLSSHQKKRIRKLQLLPKVPYRSMYWQSLDDIDMRLKWSQTEIKSSDMISAGFFMYLHCKKFNMFPAGEKFSTSLPFVISDRESLVKILYRNFLPLPVINWNSFSR